MSTPTPAKPTEQSFAVVPLAIVSDHRLTVREMRVLLALYSFRNRSKGQTVWPKREKLARITGYAPDLISRVTSSLQAKGWLVKSGTGGMSRPAKYTLSETPAKVDRVCAEETLAKVDSKTLAKVDSKTLAKVDRGKELSKEPSKELSTPPPQGQVTKTDRKGKRKTFKQWVHSDLAIAAKEANAEGLLTAEECEEFISYWMEPSEKGKTRLSTMENWDTRHRMRRALRIFFEPHRARQRQQHVTAPSFPGVAHQEGYKVPV
jgi:DNA-binding MarR family transcriptional regulator